jgi:hypothetical protein
MGVGTQRQNRERFRFNEVHVKRGVFIATALPPDVRRWLCPAVSAESMLGLRPPSGLCPTCFRLCFI